MDDNKMKQGMSVKEIENFARQHRFEVFFCLLFGFACLFSFMNFLAPGWSIFFAAAGAILSVVLPGKVEMILRKLMKFVFGQDTKMLLVFGVFALVLAVFLPWLVFALLGLFGGKAAYQVAMDSSQMKS
jgi:hypothetical protein